MSGVPERRRSSRLNKTVTPSKSVGPNSQERRSHSSPPPLLDNYDAESQSGSEDDDISSAQQSSSKLLHYTPECSTFGNEIKVLNTDSIPHHSKSSSSKIKDEKLDINRKNQVNPSSPVVSSYNMGFIACFFAVIVGIAVCAHLMGSGTETEFQGGKSLEETRDDMSRDIAKLQADTKQETHFWREVSVGLLTLSEESPRQPSVLLIAVPRDARRTAACLAHNIADIVQKAFKDPEPFVMHDTLSHLHLSPGEHKLVLDQELKRLNVTHAAIVLNLESMPPETATLLHSYCDNNNAPYKQRLILILLELDLSYINLSPQHIELAVERRLNNLWHAQLGDDHVPGLISRVAAQTMIVKPETTFVLGSLCPN